MIVPAVTGPAVFDLAVVGRRSLLVGFVGLTLAACGGRSDIPAVRDALQKAVEALDEYRDGQIQYQDSSAAGTTISGVLDLAGDDRDGVAESLTAVLEAVIRAYREQPDVRTAFVRITGQRDADANTRVESSEVVRASEDANVTTDDLEEHFDL